MSSVYLFDVPLSDADILRHIAAGQPGHQEHADVTRLVTGRQQVVHRGHRAHPGHRVHLTLARGEQGQLRSPCLLGSPRAPGTGER